MSLNSSFYRIIQIIGKNRYINDICSPTDETTIKNIVKSLVGKILVYYYHEDNSYKDLSEKLGKLTAKKLDFSKLNIQIQL